MSNKKTKAQLRPTEPDLRSTQKETGQMASERRGDGDNPEITKVNRNSSSETGYLNPADDGGTLD